MARRICAIHSGRPKWTPFNSIWLNFIEGKMEHPERLELPTRWFEASYSIQLSYGCLNDDE